ncbi:hypothetical protein [Castellaniella caeni]|uniref:hypothetical protein n=1 Tax=Castellaniella caeni TaxID=266123 RepID=UPI000C9F574F|nr:hypothetical protein [Castellaniella caeni]
MNRYGRLLLSLAFLLPTIANAAGPVKPVEKAATHGDYQAQRNLAFGYSDWPYEGQQKNPVLACAWRIVILTSDKADETDQSNYQLYCGRISQAQYEIAKTKADLLMDRIERNAR